MKTTLKNKLSNFGLVFLLTLFTFVSCSKDETISMPQEQGQIEIEISEGIESIELKNQVEQNLSKIKHLFEIAPPKSMRKSNGKESKNDPINLEDIQVNTEAYGIIKNENGKVSYTFEVDFPSDSTNVQEVINLHTYYDEDGQLKSKLMRYELTNEEFLVVTKNQSFDGFWDKISYLDLDTTDIDSTSAKNTLARSGDPCTCEDDSPPTVFWVPYENTGQNGGSSASGVGYALPPLNTLPPNVMAALQAAGVFVGVNYNNFAPYGYGHNYTTPVQYFSTNDLTIPAYNASSSGTPFNNYYAYYFSGIKNIIKDYYEKVYVPQINSYVNSSITTIEDHIVKQKAVYDFFQFTYSLYAQNRTYFYYLSSNHELTKSIFHFLAENNRTNYDYNQAKAFAISTIEAVMEVGMAEYSSNDYPGMDDGLPFEWWNDDEFVENNFSFNLAGEGFGDLTTQEKWLVAAFPARALIIYNNKELAETETINRFGNNGRNDKSDAFRHAFFNAMNSNDAGDTVARLFSNAHESEVTSNLILEVQMDLHNNNVGHTIGDDASIFVSDQDLSSSVYQSLLNGLLVYLSPLDAVLPPNFGINSSTQIIPTN
jgi:hypothetical protein